MKRYLKNPLIVTLATLTAAALISVAVTELTKPPALTDDAEVTVRIDRASVRAEVAYSPAKQAKGLAGRAKLSEDEGMLFVYDEPQTHRFWMKGVTFPIDIIWISGDTVTEVTAKAAVPKPDVSDEALPRYAPSGPVNRVLEVPAGWAARNSIQPGDPVRFNR